MLISRESRSGSCKFAARTSLRILIRMCDVQPVVNGEAWSIHLTSKSSTLPRRSREKIIESVILTSASSARAVVSLTIAICSGTNAAVGLLYPSSVESRAG